MMSGTREFVETQLDWETRDAGADDEVRAAVREDRARMKAGELDLIRARLATSTTAQIGRAADHVGAAGSAAMTNDAWNDFTRTVQLVARAGDLDQRLADLQARYAEEQGPRVVREPAVYDTGVRIRGSWIL